MTSGTEGRRARRGGGRRFKVLLGVVVFVMVAWTAVWFLAASVFEREIERGLAAAADRGTVLACDGRRVAGFPFRIELRCHDGVRLVAPDAAGELAGLTAVALVYDPTNVIVEARSPARLDRPVALEAEWALAQASAGLALDPPGLEELRAEIDEIALSGAIPFPVTADLAGLYLRPTPGAPADLDVATRLEGLIPVPEAASADVVARLAVADGASLLGGDPSALARRLAAEGIVVDVEEVRATSGETVLSVGGTLTLRPDGLLDGDLAVAIAAPDGTLPYLGLLSPELERAVSGILRNVLPFAPETRIGETPARSVSIAIRSGRVSAGLVPLGRIPPVAVAGLAAR